MLRLATTLRMRALQVEFPKCGVCIDFHCEGDIYRGEWDLHRLGEVGLVLGGGRVAKPRGQVAEWIGLHRLSPPTQASPPQVDAWHPSFGSNRLKPWPDSQGVGWTC
jgi:hypothetical protein